MAIYINWFILAVVLLGVEMATGTFYLLMVSVAMIVGGVAALLEFSLPVQFALAALAGFLGTVIMRRWKIGRPKSVVSQSFDTGQTVRVLTWHEDGTLRVHYRGAEWDAETERADTPREGTFYIKEMRASILILTHQKPH